jgi:hypothetical protein
MKDLKKNSILVAITLGLVALGWWQAKDQSIVATGSQSKIKDSPLTDSRLTLPTVVQAKSVALPAEEKQTMPAEKAASGLKFGLGYQKSANYREFISRALEHPELGGTFYAKMALFKCATFNLNMVDASQKIPHNPWLNHAKAIKQQQSMDRLQIACQGISNDEIKSMSKTVEERKRLGDPVAQAIDMQLINDPVEKQKLFPQLLDIADSTALIEYEEVIANSLTTYDGQGNGSVYYEGEVLPGKEGGILHQSWAIVPCLLGANCKDFASDNQLAYMCAIDGICYEDRYEYIKTLMFQGNQADFDKGMKYAQSIADNIRKKNYGAFYPK